jgi:hypothetical protein
MSSSSDHHGHDSDHAGAGYEKSDVAIGRLVLVTLASVIFTVTVIVVLFQYFSVEREAQFQKVVYAPESVPLRELRAQEDAVLGSYGVVNDSLHQYRIPIERAMELVANEAFANRPAGTKK